MEVRTNLNYRKSLLLKINYKSYFSHCIIDNFLWIFKPFFLQWGAKCYKWFFIMAKTEQIKRISFLKQYWKSCLLPCIIDSFPQILKVRILRLKPVLLSSISWRPRLTKLVSILLGISQCQINWCTSHSPLMIFKITPYVDDN